MTAYEEIFFQVDLTPDEAAEAIATALGGRVERDDMGIHAIGPVGGFADDLAGEVDTNFLADDPAGADYAPAGYDAYNLMWAVFKTGAADREVQRAGARALFTEVTTKLRWPALLTHDSDLAIAVWDPDTGLHEFPDDTVIDADEVLRVVRRPG